MTRVRDLRNLAVHTQGPITPGEAMEFRAIVRSILDVLKQRRPDIESKIAELGVGVRRLQKKDAPTERATSG
jgi:hypothetical protein